MTIGVLGGTFNPIHLGHLILAQEVGCRLGFSKILFVPAKIPPHKPHTISEWHRFRMVELAIRDNPFFQISRVEIDRQEISYTLHTVELLKKQVNEPIAFIIGSDNIRDLPRWYQWKTLVATCHLVIGERPQFGTQTIDELASLLSVEECNKLRQNFVAIPTLNIASSEIRKRYAEKCPNRYLVPEAVDQYILEYHLYSSPQTLEDQ
jgi:nicotinate-nucleotide adenylyltransferase